MHLVPDIIGGISPVDIIDPQSAAVRILHHCLRHGFTRGLLSILLLVIFIHHRVVTALESFCFRLIHTNPLIIRESRGDRLRVVLPDSDAISRACGSCCKQEERGQNRCNPEGF